MKTPEEIQARIARLHVLAEEGKRRGQTYIHGLVMAADALEWATGTGDYDPGRSEEDRLLPLLQANLDAEEAAA